MQNEPLGSTPLSKPELKTWRRFLENATALVDLLDEELQSEARLPLSWYDVLVHLEERPLQMKDLAASILVSKSGLTRVIDRMEGEELVERRRPAGDRRAVEVVLTARGAEVIGEARLVHRRGIAEHFADHLDEADRVALDAAMQKVGHHLRALRPHRITQ